MRGALPQVIAQTCAWLDSYFAGKVEPLPPFSAQGSPFCQEVWEILLAIPYGTTTTYRVIAQQIASQRGIAKMSAQAVGGAVARNPIPCHRVIGTNGALTGYAGGIDKKPRCYNGSGDISYLRIALVDSAIRHCELTRNNPPCNDEIAVSK